MEGGGGGGKETEGKGKYKTEACGKISIVAKMLSDHKNQQQSWIELCDCFRHVSLFFCGKVMYVCLSV